MSHRSGDLIVQQDTQEVPEIPPEDETTIYSAEEEMNEMHLILAGRPRDMFPPDSLQIVRLMKGNSTCADCQGYDEITGIMVEPMHASVTYGTLLCRRCAVAHMHRDARAFGIKSLMEDRWDMGEVLSLLEGGNGRFREFCAVTNSFPSIDHVDDHTQFIDRLYTAVPVKAYRSLLRKAVSKTLQERKGLIHAHHRFQAAPPPRDDVCVTTKKDCERFGRIMPMMSVRDYYTKVLGREWPQTEDEIIDELEASAMKSLQTPLDNDQNDNLAEGGQEMASNVRRGEGKQKLDNSHGIEEEKKDVDGNDHDAFQKSDSSDPSIMGDDPSLLGEDLVSLAEDEVSSSRKQVENYVVALKEDVPETKNTPKKRQVRPRKEGSGLAPVPETSLSIDSDDFTVLSREVVELSSNPQIRRGSHGNDDCKSVTSMGSSVGEMDLRSVGDAQSVLSSDVESISEVAKVDQEAAIVRNMESVQAHDSFRNLQTEALEMIYGPNDTSLTASNIHQLDSSSTKLDFADDSSKDESKAAEKGQVNVEKHVKFGGLPDTPPERTIANPRGLEKPSREKANQGDDVGANCLLEEFQPRVYGGYLDEELREREPSNTFGRLRRLPLPINGRMGPPLVSNANYTPKTRPSFGIVISGDKDGEEKQARRGSQSSPTTQRAPSPQQHLAAAATKVHSAYRHQMQSIARNFGRQSPRNEQANQNNDIPEYGMNLAARAQEDDLSPPRVRNSSPRPDQPQNKLGSLIANSRRTLVNNTDKLSTSFRRISESKDS